MAGVTTFTQEIADRICEDIADGLSLREICKKNDMPSRATVFKWLADIDGFSDQYARARDDQAEAYADEITQISDQTPELEPVKDADGNIVELKMNSAYVQWQKNRIDARKWVAAKLKPKKYGDKVEHTGSMTMNISDEALNAKLTSLINKSESE